jgi:Spy/CpxP family protein refolding chaperone
MATLGRLLIAAALLSLPCIVAAGAMEDRVRSVLAPPASIAEHAEDLHLSGKQRDRIIKLGIQYQSKVRRLQADLMDATERLVELIEAQPIDEVRALAELAQIHATESEIKRLHLELWIRCNAELRPLQRKRAVELANADTRRGHVPDFDNPRPGQLPDVVR